MFKRMGYWWVPAGSFGLAVMLAILAGPSSRAAALRLRQAATAKTPCKCQLKVYHLAAVMGYTKNAGAPGFTSADIEINQTTFQEKRKGAEPAKGTIQAFATFAVDFDYICSLPNGGVTKGKLRVPIEIPIGKAKTFDMTCPGGDVPGTFKSDSLVTDAEAAAKARQEHDSPEGTTCTVTVNNVDFVPDPKGAREVKYKVEAKATCSTAELKNGFDSKLTFTGANVNVDTTTDFPKDRPRPNPGVDP